MRTVIAIRMDGEFLISGKAESPTSSQGSQEKTKARWIFIKAIFRKMSKQTSMLRSSVAASNGKSFLEEPSGNIKASNSTMAKPQRTHANHVKSSSAKAPAKDQVSLGTRSNRVQQSKPVKETTFGKESAASTKSVKETTFGKESAAVTKSLKETSFVNSSTKASSKDPASYETTSGGKRFLDAVASAGSQLKSTGSQLKSTGW